ncbi:MAG: bifunctional oligoribonuclease/PAP phosphatase NrnA, partial [Candidatus Nanopelagicales bacterium]
APVLAALSDAQRVLLVGHVNPDADALGSALATGMALRSLGRDLQVTFPDDPFEVPAGLRFLPGQDLVVAPESVVAADVVISMDASSGDRIGRLLPIGEAAQTFIAVDHHASFLPFAGINVVDAAVPATGMLALELIDELGAELTADMAVCLYAAISSDTGSFRYPATTPDTLRVAARLMETGIDFAGVARTMFDTKSMGFLALQAEAINSLELMQVGGRWVAVARIGIAERERHGVAFTAVESLIDVVRTVDEADIAVVLKQDDTGLWRVSTRSKGTVDVGSVCTSLGGGGHRMAAGFTGSRDADATLASLLVALA